MGQRCPSLILPSFTMVPRDNLSRVRSPSATKLPVPPNPGGGAGLSILQLDGNSCKPHLQVTLTIWPPTLPLKGLMVGQNDHCLQRLALGFCGRDWLALPSVLSSRVGTEPEMRQPFLSGPAPSVQMLCLRPADPTAQVLP